MLNKGVSFGLFSGIPTFLIGVVLLGLIVYAGKMRELWGRIGIWFIVAGGTGNLVNRMLHGGVVDNLSFFGLFYNNIWDYLIGVGIAIFVISSLVEKSK